MLGRRINPKVSVSVVFVAAMFMNIMDITIVNVALPSIGRQFGVSETALDAVAVGYLVSLAVFIPAAGWLGDRIGSKRVLLFAIAVFTLASALCGLADSLPELVFFRVLQGVGGGMLTPVGMAMLFRTFPPEERVRASSILTVPTAVAPALGPVLGGLLVTNLSWRWVFFVNLPIGIVAFTFGLIFLQEHRQPRPGPFDLPGFLLSGIGFASVMFGVSEGPDRGWGSPEILASLIVGAALLAGLVWVELRTTQPLLKLRLYGNRLFRSTSLVLMIAMAAFLGVLFAAPLFFQIALGLNALQSGLNTFPEAIGVMVGAQLASRLFYPRIGPRRLVASGPGRRGLLNGTDVPDRVRHQPLVDADPHVHHGPVHGPGHRVHRRRPRSPPSPVPTPVTRHRSSTASDNWGARSGWPWSPRCSPRWAPPGSWTATRWPTWPRTTPPSWPPRGWPWSDPSWPSPSGTPMPPPPWCCGPEGRGGRWRVHRTGPRPRNRRRWGLHWTIPSSPGPVSPSLPRRWATRSCSTSTAC